ncbi:MAG: DUF4147 domain-containing protein [Planctomycetes bacterium]|nr:DUF4147 domain-containing protein [Planctomycetota bacterium]
MQNRDPEQLRRDALAIWQAGVEAVQPRRLIPPVLRVEGETLWVRDEMLALGDVERIVVVGGGKAGAAMAVAVEQALGDAVCQSKRLSGWVNVPADAMTPAPRYVHLHPARPAGINEPTAEGVFGAEEILRQVAGLGPNDLCLCLISGGGSALLPAPADGVSLDDKLTLTQRLSAAGANIRQLNTVRKHLSRIKGGRLAAACQAGRLVSLIISDVIGDPLDLIASGPTAQDESTAPEALEVLDAFDLRRLEIAPSAVTHLERSAADSTPHAPREANITRSVMDTMVGWPGLKPSACRVTNLLIGTLAIAVDAASEEATRRGYRTTSSTAKELEGPAEQVGRQLAKQAIAMLDKSGPVCLISGGEPTVVLVDADRRGRGGRNQQLALAAGEVLLREKASGCLILSGGTDGEDGPTDAAGAWVDLELMTEATRRGFAPADYLTHNDAYSFFDVVDGLIRTGPTQTNVGDLRIVLRR